MPLPDFKWILRLVDGEILELEQRYVKRTLDRRGAWEEPRIVYEVEVKGIVRRLWPEEIRDVDQVMV